MTFANEHLPNAAPDPAAPADSLYRQGMAHYRAHQWLQAKECFERLRALEPDRRDIDSLINELDHFIRLEEVRPAVSAAGNTVIVPEATSIGAAVQRMWMLAVPVLLVILVLAAVGLAGRSIFAQGAAPSPSPIPQAVLLTAKAVNGPLKVSPAGADTWQDWTNGRLLGVRDRIQSTDQGTIELTLADGRVALRILSDVLLEVERVEANGDVMLRQVSGRVQVQSESGLFQLETPLLTARSMGSGAVFRTAVSSEASFLATDQGRVQVTIGDRVVTVAAGEEITVALNQAAIVQPQGASSASPTATATDLPTRTATATRTATPTATATSTPAPPTPTLLPSKTPTPPPPTVTPVVTAPPPTATASAVAPTAAPVPPTNTPVPPTHTPLPPATPTRKR